CSESSIRLLHSDPISRTVFRPAIWRSGPSSHFEGETANADIWVGTSKNSRQSSDATKLPPTDSALFPFRFMDVHSWAVRDRRREQFFEVPSCLFRQSGGMAA